jgi:diguanylate cyclase (GGDEF)-like protein
MDRNSENINFEFLKNVFNRLENPIIALDKDCEVRFWNNAAEKLTGYSYKSRLDSACLRNILLHRETGGFLPCEKDCPVKKSLNDKKNQNFDAYLKHKEGYPVPVRMQIFPLPTTEENSPSALVAWHETSPKVVLPHKAFELLRMDLLDPLTQLGNRHYMEMHLISRLDEMKKYGLSLGVLLFAIDGLPTLVEAYGHQTGEKIKRVIGLALIRNVRFFEVTGRWDEDKFLMVLLNVDFNTLDLIANKLRLLVEQSTVMAQDKYIHTTVSTGGALARASDTLDSLIKRAETNLAHSQGEGKNKVTLHLDNDLA